MKQYERLGIELTTKDGFLKAIDICPNKCGAKIDCGKYIKSCGKCMADWLFSEVKTKKVKRWETYEGDVWLALTDYHNTEREFHNTVDFGDWLMEEIEVPE